MTPINFSYWLQGFFEISGQDAVTGSQSKIISQHLDLCNEWSKSETLKPEVVRMTGTVGTVIRLASGGNGWSSDHVTIVKKDLNAVFEHVIDPIMNEGKDAAKLNHLHSGGNGGGIARC